MNKTDALGRLAEFFSILIETMKSMSWSTEEELPVRTPSLD
jgi:hypothetical protein